MATVYVVQEVPGRNILSARQYGELTVLLPHTDVFLSVDPQTHSLYHKLRNFSDDDYLLLIGDPVAIGLATAVAVLTNRGRVKILKWDKQEKTYYPMQLNLFREEIAVAVS